METTSVTIGLPVADLHAATRWYAALLGRAPDLEPVDGVIEFEVHPGAWLQLTEGAPGGAATLRLGVRDLDGAVERLRELGVRDAAVQRVEDVIELCDAVDPWGNRIGFYRALASG